MPRRHVPPQPDPVDEASQDSFPASDPPAFTPVTGATVEREDESEPDERPKEGPPNDRGKKP